MTTRNRQLEEADQVVSILFDIISLSASFVSVILAVVAIWFAFHIKNEADKVNQKTQDLLIEIRTDAKSITMGVMSELEKYGIASRHLMLQNLADSIDGFKARSDLGSERLEDYMARRGQDVRD